LILENNYMCELKKYHKSVVSVIKDHYKELGFEIDFPDDLHAADIIEKHLFRYEIPGLLKKQRDKIIKRIERDIPGCPLGHEKALEHAVWIVKNIENDKTL